MSENENDTIVSFLIVIFLNAVFYCIDQAFLNSLSNNDDNEHPCLFLDFNVKTWVLVWHVWYELFIWDVFFLQI